MDAARGVSSVGFAVMASTTEDGLSLDCIAIWRGVPCTDRNALSQN